MKLKYFDEINPNELEDYYSTDIELHYDRELVDHTHQ